MELLEAWRLGDVDERQVHESAEKMIDEGAKLPHFEETDPNSIPVEVLVHLDALNHQLITTEDIGVIQEFLSAAPGEDKEAWARWRDYWNNLDIESRRLKLKHHPYYST